MPRQPKSANTIYDHARGDGWILTAQGDLDPIDGGHRIEIVLYYTDEQKVITEEVKNTRHHHGVDGFFRQFLDIGAELGPYEGAKPEPNTDYADQPRAVRMQRHATDIYDVLGHVRGMSPTIAVRAAEEFGSTWAEKEQDDWHSRVKSVGEGRAGRFHEALHGE